MHKFVLKRPPRVRMFRLEKDIKSTVYRNMSTSKVYYVLLYNQGETLLGTYSNGAFLLAGGKVFKEAIMNEIRIFDFSCEMRIVRNEEKLFVGRQLVDENHNLLSDSIKRITDADYLYDELYELSGETSNRSFNLVSPSRRRVHKGLVGGHLHVPLPEIRWLGIRNYIEAEDDTGLKFTDSRLVALLDNKRQIFEPQKLMNALSPK